MRSLQPLTKTGRRSPGSQTMNAPPLEPRRNMSWHETRSEKPCFCGKGKLVEINRSDDWNRHEHREHLECPECAAAYERRFVRFKDGDFPIWGSAKKTD